MEKQHFLVALKHLKEISKLHQKTWLQPRLKLAEQDLTRGLEDLKKDYEIQINPKFNYQD